MTLVTRIHDLDGTPVLDLNPATGYRRADITIGGVTWRRRVAVSDFVDGEFETGAVKAATKLTLVFKVTGDTWAQVEQRVQALTAAASEHRLYVVGADGVTRTWRGRPADIDASYTREDRTLRRRFVTLEVPVQPNPTTTGA